MDYTDEGKRNQKLFAHIKLDTGFEKHVFDFVLKDDDGYKAAQYVRGLLNKTSNETLYIRALTIARRFEKNQSIWAEILYAVKSLVIKKKKVKWIFSFLNTLLNTPNFDLFNYDIKTFVYIILFYEDKPSTWYIGQIWDKPRFVWWRPYVEQAFLDNMHLIDEFSVLFSAATYFSNINYYNMLLDNIPNKSSYNDAWFYDIINRLTIYHKKIDGFYGFLTVLDLMKKYKNEFSNNEKGIDSLTDLITKENYINNDICDLYLEIITPWYHINTKIRLLDKLVDVANYEPINLELYSLTNDERYLPQTTKDIFIF